MTDQNKPRTLKPRRASFLVAKIIAGTFASATLSGLVWIGLAKLLPGISFLAAVAFALLLTLTVTSALVAYRKEHYELYHDHIRCRRGGLLSDQTTELDVRNITHVKTKLPWLRFKFFGIGHVLIESAGTSHPAVLRFVHAPESVYDDIRNLMQNNGYALQQRQLLHEERPALVGVIADSIGIIVAFPFVLFGAASTLAPIITTMPDQLELAELHPALRSLAASAFILLAIAGLAFIVVHFLNLRRRTYRVYDDAVVYEEGFLTRNNAFIPYENIADAETRRTLVDQILGLYNVQVSCQGSSSEIRFRSLRGGQKLSAAIDDLVVRAREQPNPREKPDPPRQPGAPPQLPQSRHPTPTLVPPAQAWTAEFRMDTGRVLLPAMLLLPLFPVWVIVMIRGIIGLSATSYAVKPSSVRQSFRFLHTDEREFAYEKITGFIIKKNPWDYLFKTLTIRLWSIGSGRSIELSHIKASQLDLPALMRQIGIPASSPQPLTNPTSFSLTTFLLARLAPVLTVTSIAALLASAAFYTPDQQARAALGAILAVLATTTLIGFLYSWLYHRYQQLSFHPQHIEAQQGLLVRHHYFVCYRNIKKTLFTRYPGGDKGKLQFFVAGEEEVIQGKQKNQNNTGLCKPCSFTSDFLTGIRDKQQLVDDILTARVPAAPGATPAEPFSLAHESPRSVGNSVVKLLLLSLLPPVLLLLPVLLPRCILSAKRWRYRVESGRVVATWGILYRHHASVLVDRIDSLRHSQGPLNKMFHNGTVTIMTAGSSKPDLILANTPNFNTLYEEIRQRSSSSHQSPPTGH